MLVSNINVNSINVTYKDGTAYAAIDGLERMVVRASDYGVTTDDADNADALYALGQYISNATEPLYVIFPKGVSLVGSQQLAGAVGAGYSWRPSYLARTWEDASATGWFSVNNTNLAHVLDMRGWTLKLNAGMRLGAYNPVTGAVAPDQTTETPNTDFSATTGVLVKLRLAPNVTILGGVLDNNLTGTAWGGKYGNIGYQSLSYCCWINQSSGVQVLGTTFQNSPVDGLYTQSTGRYNDLDVVPQTLIKDCIFQDCGRNCYSLTGGANVRIVNPTILRSGRKATGIAGNYSGPETLLDIEAEGGSPFDIAVEGGKLIQAGRHCIYTVSTPGQVAGVKVTGTVIHSMHAGGAIANVGNSRNIVFRDCRIYGSVIDVNSPPMALDCYTFEKCTFNNRYGNDYADTYKLNFRCFSFKDNSITFAIPDVPVTAATINILDQDGITGGLGAVRFTGNRLEVYGDASKVTFPNGLGGINYFRNADLYVNAAGLTGGTLKLLTGSSGMSSTGFSTNSANFNFGSTMRPDSRGNGLYHAAQEVRYAGTAIAASDNVQDMGSASGRFKTGYFTDGVIVRDGVTKTFYRVRVVNGALNVVADAG